MEFRADKAHSRRPSESADFVEAVAARKVREIAISRRSHIIKRRPLLEFWSARLNPLQKGTPFMTSTKYVGMDVHLERS
jgi:hypothetical protein